MALALNTEIGVNDVDIALGDCVNRTLRQANSASNTVFSDLKRQSIHHPSIVFYKNRWMRSIVYSILTYRKMKYKDFFGRKLPFCNSFRTPF